MFFQLALGCLHMSYNKLRTATLVHIKKKKKIKVAERLYLMNVVWKLIFFLLLMKVWSKVAQSCPTLCDPMDCSLPGSSVHRILQAKILEWVAIFFSRGFSWPRDQTQVSCIAGRCFTLWANRKWRHPSYLSMPLSQYHHEREVEWLPVGKEYKPSSLIFIKITDIKII